MLEFTLRSPLKKTCAVRTKPWMLVDSPQTAPRAPRLRPRPNLRATFDCSIPPALAPFTRCFNRREGDNLSPLLSIDLGQRIPYPGHDAGGQRNIAQGLAALL